MKLFCDSKNYKIYNGSMLDMLEVIEENSIDSIVCDPPYEIGFMGRSWDKTGIAFQSNTWQKCFEVLKDGGYLLAFGGSRTFHRIAVAIEDAGFELRDTIMWLYGSGFPKSMNIAKGIEGKILRGSANTTEFHKLKGEEINTKIGFSKQQYEQGARPEDYTERHKSLTNIQYETDLAKQWQGWGSQLKPAYEPIIVARKPFKTSLVENVMINGVGGINIDECRVGNEIIKGGTMPKFDDGKLGVCNYKTIGASRIEREDNIGRFPANVIHDGSEEVESGFPDTSNNGGSASRYFYTAKASKKDRDEGLDIVELQKVNDGRKTEIDNPFQRGETLRKNIHPTVKPVELMQYLVRLVSPKGATILDPFMGSGSTGKAVMFENRERDANYKFIGIDLEKEYCEIAKARIDYALNKYEYDYLQELKQAEEKGQLVLDLFGGDV